MSDDWLTHASDGEPWQAPSPLPPVIVTERTIVRRWTAGDAEALFEAIDRSREAILPWMLWSATDHRRLEHTIFYIERFRRAAAKMGCKDFPMGIFDRESGAVLGATGLHDIHGYARTAEVGWWLQPQHRGQGLCREAVAGLMGQALRPVGEGGWGLHRLFAMVAVSNVASRRVCERIGLRLEGRYRKERYLGYPPHDPPGWIDTLRYAVTDEEWDESAGRAVCEPWPHGV